MSTKPIIGIDIDGPNVRIGKVQNDSIVAHHNFKLSVDDSLDNTINEVLQGIDCLIDKNILGIGIGVPGTVDIDKGIVYHVARIPSWKEVPLKDILQKRFKIPVYINNDANCFAVGEKYFGKARKYENAVGLIIGEGYGAGIIVNNRMYCGYNCGVGEFGEINYNGQNYEYYCSTQFFINEFNTRFDQFLERAMNDDARAKEVFENYGLHLAHAIQTILHTLDPDIIVLGGAVSKAYPFFKKKLWNQLKSSALNKSIEHLVIDVSDQDNIAILGAAALYLDAQEIRNLKESEAKRKKAESALYESEEKYFKLFNHIADPILIFDKESFRILDFNESVERVYGYSRSELKNMTPLDLHPPEEFNKVRKRLKIRNKDIPFTYTHVRKDGKHMNVEILSDEIDYEGHPASLSIVRDITERIKSEKEAQRRATQTALINEVGKRVSSQLDLNSLLGETVTSLSHSFDYYGVMILLLDSKKKRLNLRAIAGGYADIFPSDLSIKIGEGMIGMAAKTGKTQHSDDVRKEPNYVMKADEVTRSELSVPICSGKKTLGVLDIQSDNLNAFDKSDIAATETLTSQIAAAIENARLYERAQEEIVERKEVEKELRKSRNKLIRAMKETDNIMQNVEEGLFLLNSKFEMGSQFSKALQEIFNEDELAKVNLLDILEGKISPDDLNSVQEYLELMFDPAVIEENILELNPLSDIEMNFKVPGKLLSRTRYLTFKFRRIIVNDEIVGLITTVNDITEQVQLTKKLEESQQQSKRQMEWLLNLLHVEPSLIQEFIDSAQSEFDEINRILKKGATENNFQEILDKIYRSVHLVKGNASLLDLSLFASVAHKCEELISSLKEKSSIEGKDFVALNLKISEMQQSIQEVKSLIEKISNIQSHFRPKRSYESEKLLSSINNFIANLSKDSAKSVQFNHHSFDGMSIPHNYRLLVKDLLVQLARNSVSHGIESEKERTKLNKDKVATIKLSSKFTKEYFEFTFRDDGRGLQIDRLKQLAIASGRWEKSDIEKWNNKKIAELIFEPGISTQAKADLVAGRGIGMNIIREKVQKHKGKIVINNSPGKYCEFIIKLPI